MKMKKAFILLPLSIALLSGCDNNKKVDLKYGQMYSTDVSFIDYLTLKEKIDDKETFLLTVSAPTCSCWSTFRSVLNAYIDEHHVLVYAIQYDQFHDESGKSLDTFGLNIQSGYTSFAIVENGELRANLKSGKEQLFKSITSFEKYMSDMVSLPKAFYVSLEQVDELYKKDETSLIYFARSTCGDCGYFDKHFLNNYEISNTMFILDCETIGIREYDEEGHLTPESAIKWAAFKQAYGLGSEHNPDYGYDTGYVPTLLLVHGGESVSYLSGCVYFNDTVSKDDNGYYVSNSYYTEERLSKLEYLNDFSGTKILKGERISEEAITAFGEYYMWDQDDAAKLHNPLAKALLDYALPKVNFTKF